MALICTVCGAENMEGSIYCEDCGARLPVASGSPAATPAPIAAPLAAAPAPAPAPAPAANTPAAAEPTREEMPAVPASADGTATCTTCGASNPAGETYCEDCGAALPGASSDTPIPAATIADTPPPITPNPAAAPHSS